MHARIKVRSELLATHCWPQAPDHRRYLASNHAHVFKFEVCAKVRHNNRDIEFHDLRDRLSKAISSVVSFRTDGPPSFGEMSCEQIGSEILRWIPGAFSVAVSEDGQCDALIISEKFAPERRAYLASSSKGDRDLLREISAKLTAKGYMIFAPCLGFSGAETPEIRPSIMQVCFSTVMHWAEILFILEEGIPSEGCDTEEGIAKSLGIPTIKLTKFTVDGISGPSNWI